MQRTKRIMSRQRAPDANGLFATERRARYAIRLSIGELDYHLFRSPFAAVRRKGSSIASKMIIGR